MKQKNFLKILTFTMLTIFSINSFGQTIFYTQSFEGAINTGYTSSGVFSDGSGDYFTLIGNGSDPSGDPSYTNIDGAKYWAAEDTQDAGNPNGSGISNVNITSISIAGKTSLSIKGLFASGGKIKFDSTDYMRIYAQVDSGGYSLIGAFESSGSTNTTFQQDTNLDGNGDGTILSRAFQEFVFGLAAVTGNTLDIRIDVFMTSGDEEVAFDKIEVQGISASTPTIGFDTATSSQTETDTTFNVSIPVTTSNYDGNQIDLSIASSGTAEAEDFTLNTSTLSFIANGSQNISLDINADTNDFDNETIILTLTETSAVTGLVISQATHTVTVTDDETAPSVGFDPATSSETETDVTFTSANIPITVSNYSGTQIDINVTSSLGTAEAEDFTFTSPTALSFTSDGTQNITFSINDDADTDAETIIFTITETSAVSGLVISQATHTVTITDDEIPPVPSAGVIFITEVLDSENGFNNDYLELFNNSNQSVSLGTSKLLRFSSGGSYEFSYDFGVDEATASADITIPAFGFLIIARGNTRADFNSANGITLDASVNFNGGRSDLFFGTGRRWKLKTGGTPDTDDGTLIDDTLIGVGADKSYRNIFTGVFVSGSASDGTMGALEYLVYSGGSWVNSIAMNVTTSAKDTYFYDDYTVTASAAANNLGINTGKTLTVNSSVGLDVNGNLTVNGNMSINPGGSIILDGTSSGNVTYNRTLDFVSGNANGWYLVSSPVSGETYDNAYATANGLATSFTKRGLATYNDAAASGSKWTYLKDDDSNAGNFTSGIGYSVKRGSTGTISFTGTLNTDNVTAAVLAGGNGFNLLGNPYTSYINSATFLTDNTGNLVTETIWLWNKGTGNYETKVTGDSFILSPAQGFFVRVNAATNLNFAKTNQTTNADTFQRSSKPEVQIFMSDGENSRYFKVYYIEGTSTGFDNGYDGETFGGITNSIDVYTQLLYNNKGKDYQIQSLPKDYENLVIPIGVNAASGKEIVFTAATMNLPTDLKVFLEDRETNTFTRLDEASSNYNVTLANDLRGIGRFYLYTTQSALSIKDIILDNVSIYKADSSTLRIVGLQQGNAKLRLFNILGKQMMHTSFTSNGVKDISLPKLAKGVYIVKLQTDAGKLNKKIILE